MQIVDYLVKELGVTTRQAEGGAGLLLELAQRRLTNEQFAEVAVAMPAISDVIGKAPRQSIGQVGAVREKLSRWLGGLGGLLAVVGGFDRLGCDKMRIADFAQTLVKFFRQQGNEQAATLLQGALR